MRFSFIALLMLNATTTASFHAMEQNISPAAQTMLPIPPWAEYAQTLTNYRETCGIPLNDPAMQPMLAHHYEKHQEEYNLITAHFARSPAELTEQLAPYSIETLYNTLDLRYCSTSEAHLSLILLHILPNDSIVKHRKNLLRQLRSCLQKSSRRLPIVPLCNLSNKLSMIFGSSSALHTYCDTRTRKTM